MSREDLIKRFEWNDGGYSFGACAFGAAMLWAGDKPGEGRPDLASTVFLTGPETKYTDEELTKLATFADIVDAEYDRHWKWRRGCNAILVDKTQHGWVRKRLSWTSGPMFSKTLDEAIKVMSQGYVRELEAK